MKVATIEKVLAVINHDNAQFLEIITVLGWKIVCKKDCFKVGDLVAYINIDSVVEPHPEFEFLVSKKYRIKPIQIRGEISQGICFPLSILQKFTDVNEFEEGQDISEILKAKHYEKPIPMQLAGLAKGLFPNFLIRTDEDNLRNYPIALKEIANVDTYITKKIDGSSGTYFAKDGAFGVCSRNIELEDGDNAFWNVARKYNLSEKLLSIEVPVCVQGEVYGPGIQNNPTGIKSLSIAIFNLYFINENRYGTYDEIVEFSKKHNIPMVDIIGVYQHEHNLSDLIELANNTFYDNKKVCEGIVLRPKVPIKSYAMEKMVWSAKVLSEIS